MVNINIELPDELHRQLKLASVLKDKTLKEYVIELLNASLQNEKAATKEHKG